MNVSELARKLKVSKQELLEILPMVGFHIGARAIKIDNRQAQKIIEQWPRLLAQYKEMTKKEEVEEKVEALPEKKEIPIPSFIKVKDFAEKLKMPLPKVMAELMKNGVLSSMNEEIDFDTAAIVGSELGYEIIEAENQAEEKERDTSHKLESLLMDDKKDLKDRPPVVVVMGHVDHGKTKLLDMIRQTDVIAGESGGITQHIGAYQVHKKNKLITFIDTPGHEAFTTMRSRGARIADVAILVIAADDSIQPQTKESIKIIKSAGLPMIVAINKIDKPDANPDKVKQDLAALNLTPEDWGGKTICIPISAKAGTNIDGLLDMVLLVAETERENIMANPNRQAVGTIIESHIDRAEGPVATALVQNGTLKIGDLVDVDNNFYGKIRSMKNYLGEDVKEALPSTPVKILGLKAAPSVGDVMEIKGLDEKRKKIKKYQLHQKATDYSRPLETIDEEKTGTRSLNIVLKADVLGSLEAIISSLTQMGNEEVKINIISKGLGNINQGDMQRAETGHAVVLGFHVKAIQEAQNYAKDKKIEVKIYDVIYHLLEEIKAKLEKMLNPEVIKTELGRLKVLAIFNKEKDSVVIGGKVTKGNIKLNAKADIIRNKAKIGTGHIVQVQVNKVDVNEVEMGKDCGIKYEGKPVAEAGDIVEVYMEEVKEKKLA